MGGGGGGGYDSGVHFTTRCRALTAGLSLTLNLTTNSTIPVSQPLSWVSLSCANLSLSLTSQFSQWSSSIETTSSDHDLTFGTPRNCTSCLGHLLSAIARRPPYWNYLCHMICGGQNGGRQHAGPFGSPRKFPFRALTHALFHIEN